MVIKFIPLLPEAFSLADVPQPWHLQGSLSFTLTALQSLPSHLPSLWHTLPGPGGSVGHGCKLSWPHNFCISCVHKTTQAMLPSSASLSCRGAPFCNSVDNLSLGCWTWQTLPWAVGLEGEPLCQFMLFLGGFTFSQVWALILGSCPQSSSPLSICLLYVLWGHFTSMVNIKTWWVYMLFCLHTMSLDIKLSFPLAV